MKVALLPPTFWAAPGPVTVALPKSRLKVAVSGAIALFASGTQLFAPLIVSVLIPAALFVGRSMVAVPCQVRLSGFQLPVTGCGTVSPGPRKLALRGTVGSISRSAVNVTVRVPCPKFPAGLTLVLVLLLEKAIAPAPSLKVGACCGSGLATVTEAEYWLGFGALAPHQSFVAVAATLAL